jgi:electron transport complex protein RnfG
MAETTCIGNKIATDAAFLQNFAQLDARLNNAGTGLAHEIITVKQGSKTNPWEIDAITGATISSRAVGRMLNDSAQQMLPVISAHLEQLRITNGTAQ